MSIIGSFSDYAQGGYLSSFTKHYDSGMMGSLANASKLIDQAKSALAIKNLSSFDLFMDQADYYISLSHDEFEYSIKNYYSAFSGDYLAKANEMIASYNKELDRVEALFEATLKSSESHTANQYQDNTGGGTDNAGGGGSDKKPNNELEDDLYDEKKKEEEEAGQWIPGVKNEYVIYGGAGLLALAIIMRR